MNFRYTAVLATLSNSFSDAVLDYTVNKFDYYRVLLYTSFFAFALQLLYGMNTEITVTYFSIPYLLVHAVFVLFINRFIANFLVAYRPIVNIALLAILCSLF